MRTSSVHLGSMKILCMFDSFVMMSFYKNSMHVPWIFFLIFLPRLNCFIVMKFHEKIMHVRCSL